MSYFDELKSAINSEAFNEGAPIGEIDKLYEKISNDAEKAGKELGHANIIIAGGTGVGKSTLINAVFGEDLVKTGLGRPVTDCITVTEKPGFPISIYDTVGFELSGTHSIEKIEEDICKTITDSRADSNKEKWIHIMWYCISLGKPRIQEAEIHHINRLCELGVPVILVITYSFNKVMAKKLKEELLSYNLNVKEIIIVLAKELPPDPDDPESIPTKAFGVDTLCEKTFEYLDEAARKAFVANQKSSIRLKRETAKRYVAYFAAINFGTVFIPLPIADAPILMASECAMLAKVAAIFGIKEKSAAFLPAVLGICGATILGKSIVSGLFKLFPGAGTAVAGTINGGTASALTIALGSAYIELLTKVEEGKISEEDVLSREGIKFMKDFVKEELKKRQVS